VANKWFVNLNLELDQTPKSCDSQAGVGVEIGIKTLATLSNGEVFEAAKHLKQLVNKLL